MKQPTYLLLGWKPKPDNRKYESRPTPERIPGQLPLLAVGNAKSVISAACSADCGVLLFDTTKTA